MILVDVCVGIVSGSYLSFRRKLVGDYFGNDVVGFFTRCVFVLV